MELLRWNEGCPFLDEAASGFNRQIAVSAWHGAGIDIGRVPQSVEVQQNIGAMRHMRSGFPIARPGEVIGLLGGSFDPAHRGHVHITQEALRRFGLSRVWWLVSPGNPLKSRGPAPLVSRIERARQVMQHPRVIVTDIEAQLGTRYTAETIRRLRAVYPGVRFVWLMGADNLAQLHRWQDWRKIMNSVPIGVLARPGDRISARMSPAARLFRPQKLSGRASYLLGRAEAPAWCFVNVPMVEQSSTAIRAAGGWGDSPPAENRAQ